MPRRNKIALIGAGNIGGELAALAARRELGDIVRRAGTTSRAPTS